MHSRPRPAWAAADIPLNRPSLARMYDYYLGGNHNFEVDRRAAEEAIAFYPDIPNMMRANRAFLRRTVEYAARQGIDQFLDLGSGIPTVGHVHEIVRRVQPGARVVYVDFDPITIAHSAPLLAGDPRTVAIEEDIRNSAAILTHPEVRARLDFARPIAVLFLLVLHSILDDAEALRTVRAYKQAMAPGSYLLLSHATLGDTGLELPPPDTSVGRLASLMHFRSYDAITPYFEGLTLEEPGLVALPRWHPEGLDDLFYDEPDRAMAFGGVAKKPAVPARG